MLKKIFFFLLGLIALAIIALIFFGSTFINKTVESAINTIGPKVTQTEVAVEQVNFSLTSGSGTLTGIKVGNPEGYQKENIFELGEIQVDIRPSSLTSDTILVEKIYINSPKISYEKTLQGSNIKDLLNNIQAFSNKLPGGGQENNEPQPKQDKPAKKVIIEDFQIVGGTVNAGVLGLSIEVPLPNLAFQNIGAKDGPSYADIGEQILQEILKVTGPAIEQSTDFFGESTKALGETGKATLETTKEEIIDRGFNEIIKLFGQ
jgi:hypothetical protein